MSTLLHTFHSYTHASPSSSSQVVLISIFTSFVLYLLPVVGNCRQCNFFEDDGGGNNVASNCIMGERAWEGVGGCVHTSSGGCGAGSVLRDAHVLHA